MFISNPLPESALGSPLTSLRPIILALHGTAASPRQWSALVQTAGEGYQVLTPTVPGYESFGNKAPDDSQMAEWHTGSPHGITTRIQPLLRLLERIHTPVHLLGHSFGGTLALALADNCPHKVASLTLYEPTQLSALAEVDEPDATLLLGQFGALAKLVARASAPVAMEAFIDFWLGEGRWQTMSHKEQQRLMQMARICARDFADALAECDVHPPVVRYTGPMQVLYGQASVDAGQRVATALASIRPNAELRMLAGMDHLGPVQNARQFNADYLRHLESLVCQPKQPLPL